MKHWQLTGLVILRFTAVLFNSVLFWCSHSSLTTVMDCHRATQVKFPSWSFIRVIGGVMWGICQKFCYALERVVPCRWSWSSHQTEECIVSFCNVCWSSLFIFNCRLKCLSICDILIYLHFTHFIFSRCIFGWGVVFDVHVFRLSLRFHSSAIFTYISWLSCLVGQLT